MLVFLAGGDSCYVMSAAWQLPGPKASRTAPDAHGHLINPWVRVASQRRLVLAVWHTLAESCRDQGVSDRQAAQLRGWSGTWKPRCPNSRTSPMEPCQLHLDRFFFRFASFFTSFRLFLISRVGRRQRRGTGGHLRCDLRDLTPSLDYVSGVFALLWLVAGC